MLKFSDKRGSVSADPLMLMMLAAVLIFDEGIASLCMLAAIMIHESGHMLIMRILGVKIARVRISGLNIGIIRKTGQKKPWVEMLISAGGILFNTLCVGMLLLICPKDALALIYANTTVILANILPIEGLDGGDIHELVLQNMKNHTLRASWIGFKILVITGAVFISFLLAVKYNNPSLGIFLLYTLVSGRMNKRLVKR